MGVTTLAHVNQRTHAITLAYRHRAISQQGPRRCAARGTRSFLPPEQDFRTAIRTYASTFPRSNKCSIQAEGGLR